MAEKANAAGAKATGGELKFDLTPIDAKFFVTMAKYLPKAIEMDWEAFASDLGLKSAVVAKVRYRQIRAKLGLNEPAGAGSPDAKKTANKVTKARKPAAKAKKDKAAQVARALEMPDNGHEQQLIVSGADTPSYNQDFDYGAIHTGDFSNFDFAFGPNTGVVSDANGSQHEA